MIFHVYVVKLKDGHKERLYIDSYDDLGYAKQVCNCYTCGGYDYAYIKAEDGTIYFIRNPEYKVIPYIPGATE